MAIQEIYFQRDYDFPRAIVWDALVDPVLVEGWLGDAQIDATPGGEYRLEWLGSPDYPGTNGTITALVEPERLTVATAGHGEFSFALVDCDGGARGTYTRLHLKVLLEIDDAFAPRVSTHWALRLDYLAELLRGHPVDWRKSGREELTSLPSTDRARDTDRA